MDDNYIAVDGDVEYETRDRAEILTTDTMQEAMNRIETYDPASRIVETITEPYRPEWTTHAVPRPDPFRPTLRPTTVTTVQEREAELNRLRREHEETVARHAQAIRMQQTERVQQIEMQLWKSIITLLYRKLIINTAQYKAIEDTLENSGNMRELIYILDQINEGTF